MLGKLFKYDFRSTVKPLILFSIIALAVSGAGTGLRYVAQLDVFDDSKLYAMRSLISMLVMGCYFAIFAFVLVTLILVVVRYYRNLFTEEGYLTFTLPTTPGKILLSKFLSAYLTVFIAIVTALTGTAIMTFAIPSSLFGTSFTFVDLLRDIKDLFINNTIESIEIYILIPLFIAETLLVLFLSVTLGSLLAKKLKLFASFGIFYGIMTVLNFIRSFLFSFYIVNVANLFDTSSRERAVSLLLLSLIILSLTISILSYIFTHTLLKKKLNI